jgi:hypothetical protein
MQRRAAVDFRSNSLKTRGKRPSFPSSYILSLLGGIESLKIITWFREFVERLNFTCRTIFLCCCIVCIPMAELVYLTLFTVLSGAPNTQSASQTPKYCFLVGRTYTAVCCLRNIPQYRFSPVEYRQPKQPSSYQLHHLVLRHLSQVVKNPPCSGFEPGISQTRVRRSNHYTIELY